MATLWRDFAAGAASGAVVGIRAADHLLSVGLAALTRDVLRELGSGRLALALVGLCFAIGLMERVFSARGRTILAAAARLAAVYLLLTAALVLPMPHNPVQRAVAALIACFAAGLVTPRALVAPIVAQGKR